jgi:hypothetical protein
MTISLVSQTFLLAHALDNFRALLPRAVERRGVAGLISLSLSFRQRNRSDGRLKPFLPFLYFYATKYRPPFIDRRTGG